MTNDYLDGLDADLDSGDIETKPINIEEHPCEHCGGTGIWNRGRNRNGESKCFACKGTGSFKTSAAARQRQRQQSSKRKSARLSEAMEAFEEQHPGLMLELHKIRDWNAFAASLGDQFARKGYLSEAQVNAARRTLAKIDASTAARDAQQEERAVTVDLSPIREMFATAAESGLKRPTYRAEGIVISRAPDHGANAGSLYVKTHSLKLDSGDYSSGEYEGKIDAHHTFRPSRRAHAETTAALHKIAENPAEAAVRYGRLTGSCACCGRELTNKTSVEMGIGPVCATKFGF